MLELTKNLLNKLKYVRDFDKNLIYMHINPLLDSTNNVYMRTKKLVADLTQTVEPI